VTRQADRSPTRFQYGSETDAVARPQHPQLMDNVGFTRGTFDDAGANSRRRHVAGRIVITPPAGRHGSRWAGGGA